jgi:hypothetical protein
VLVVVALAAAAALVVLVPRLVTGPTGPGPSGTTLGVGDLELVAPAEDAADWSVVEWNGPEGERFRVDIVDPATDEVLAGPNRTGETSWTPDLSGDLSTWPERVLIRLEILAPGEPATERVTRIVLRPR